MNIPSLNDIMGVAQKASNKVMDIYHSSFKISFKKDNSPVTKGDLLSHHIILEGLQKLTPSIPILSEESEEVDFSIRRLWTYYWLVDPLDGTRSFIRRKDEFTINIALIHQQRPLVGVIMTPVTGLIYAAAQGEGAWCYGKTQRQRLSVKKQISPPWKVVIGHSHTNSDSTFFIHRLNCVQKVVMGSALKFCAVAEGGAHIYPCFGQTFEWDTAAGQCLVEAAGGYVTDLTLQPLSYNTKKSLLNPHFLVFGDETVNWQEFLPS